MTKTYTTRSNALRAAKSAGFTKEEVEILGSDAAFYFEPIGAVPAAEMDEATQAGINIVGTETVTEGGPLGPMFNEADRIPAPAKQPAPIGAELTLPAHEYLCPHCGIDLTNGVGEHEGEVNGKHTVFTKTNEYWCMACEGEFGPAIPAPVAKAEKKAGKPQLNSSTVENPCKRVWAIADEMMAKDPSTKRGAVISECVARGIAFYTARTQYQAWLAIRKEMAAAVRAVLPNNGL